MGAGRRGERDPQRFRLSVLAALRQTAPGSALVRAVTAAPDQLPAGPAHRDDAAPPVRRPLLPDLEMNERVSGVVPTVLLMTTPFGTSSRAVRYRSGLAAVGRRAWLDSAWPEALHRAG